MRAPVQPKKQKWAVVSVLTPRVSTEQRNVVKNLEPGNVMAVSIYGAFATIELAEEYILQNQKKGFTYYDMTIVKMNEFVPYPPPDNTMDTVYQEEHLQSIFEADKKVREKANDHLMKRVMEDREIEEKAKAARIQRIAEQNQVPPPESEDSTAAPQQDKSEPEPRIRGTTRMNPEDLQQLRALVAKKNPEEANKIS